jgi:hypothetical protein
VDGVDMDPRGDEVKWRFIRLEMDIHRLDVVDLEQSKNVNDKLIHSMWAGLSLPKNMTGPGAARGS